MEECFTLEKIHSGSVYALDFHSPSQVLVTGSNDKHLRISKPLTGEICSALKGHTGTVRVVKFRPTRSMNITDEPMLLSGGAGDFKARLWDIHSGTAPHLPSVLPTAHQLGLLVE